MKKTEKLTIIGKFKRMHTVLKGLIIGLILFIISVILLGSGFLSDKISLFAFAFPAGTILAIGMSIDASAIDLTSLPRLFLKLSLINFIFYLGLGLLIGLIVFVIKKIIKKLTSKKS